MKKRIFNWNHSKNKKHIGRHCPHFDFIEGCVKDIVIWWNENQFCIDMDRISEIEIKGNNLKRLNKLKSRGE